MSLEIFIGVLLVLEAMVYIEALIAFKTQYFWRHEPPQTPKGVVPGFFLEHGGMWGDALIISPLVAHICATYAQQWSGGKFLGTFAISILIGIGMMAQWLKGSHKVWDVFHQAGKVKAAGWIHFFYMIACLTAILLFFIGSKASTEDANIVAVGLAIHIMAGVIQPEWKTFGKVSLGTVATACTAWLAIAGTWWHLVHR